jgi:hypothetical protein
MNKNEQTKKCNKNTVQVTVESINIPTKNNDHDIQQQIMKLVKVRQETTYG